MLAIYEADGAADAGRLTAAELATAVITVEAFGSLLGRAAEGAVVSLGAAAGLSRASGLTTAYAVFLVHRGDGSDPLGAPRDRLALPGWFEAADGEVGSWGG